MNHFISLRNVCALLAIGVCLVAPYQTAGEQPSSGKPLLVIESRPSNGEDNYTDFPRLLLNQIAKAGVFRCVDRDVYRTQAKENALGGNDDIEFKSAGYCISWRIGKTQSSRGVSLTVVLGYNNIGRTGNGELLKSEDVVVQEKQIRNGEDILSFAAKKAAKAILFCLRPPMVIEIENPNMSMPKATVDYGKDFLSVGERVCFERKKEKRGRMISRKIAEGKVVSVTTDSSCDHVEKLLGKDNIAEDDTLSLMEEMEAPLSGVCPKCNGKKKIKMEISCADCNGQGKVWRIKRQRTLVACPICKGRGSRTVIQICPECKGTGKSE